ncbi:MAG TPA: hypothetical protein VFF73_16515 [Planctomycetota bacterium]|nr:hypothetical protein [Planctomycetota bacterium]
MGPTRALLVAALLLGLLGCQGPATITEDGHGRRVFVDVPVPAGYMLDTVDAAEDLIVYECAPFQAVVLDDLVRFYEGELPKAGWSDVQVTADRTRVLATKPGLSLVVFLTETADAPPEVRAILDVEANAARTLTVLRRPR